MKHRERQSRNAWLAAVSAQDNEILVTAKKLIDEAQESIDIVLATDSAPSHVLYSALGDWMVSASVGVRGIGAGGAVDTAAGSDGAEVAGLAPAGSAGAESEAMAGSRALPGADTGPGGGPAPGSGRRAVRTRLLCTPSALDWQFIQRHSGGPMPLEVRVARIPLLAAVLVDGKAALVCADSAVGRRASTIRDPGVTEALRTLFAGIWRKSLAASERLDVGDRGRKEMLQQILEWLRLGVTDEVAARELSVSVRTYRRYVAEMMSLLGADSRFQAGVRAAELGLLPAASTQDIR